MPYTLYSHKTEGEQCPFWSKFYKLRQIYEPVLYIYEKTSWRFSKVYDIYNPALTAFQSDKDYVH